MSTASINGANGASQAQPLKRRIKKASTDPFGVSKPRGLAPARPNGHLAPQVNGQPGPRSHALRPSTPSSQRSTSPSAQGIAGLKAVSGFSDPDVVAGRKPYVDYKLVTTKKDLLDGLRYHILQLTNDKGIDVRDPAQFSQPAHLHRRDPRTAPPGQIKEDFIEPKDGMTAGEREELNKKKELRQQERAANLAQIAPSQASRKLGLNKIKAKQVHRTDLTDAEKRRRQAAYEEKLPWHLEDFDNKHCFVGENHIGATNTHAAFVYEPTVDSKTGKFRLIPIEKVYHFQPKRDARHEMTLEEAEAAMKRKGNVPDFIAQLEEKQYQERVKDQEQKTNKMYSGESKSNKFAGRTGEDADYDFDDREMFDNDDDGEMFAVKDEDELLAEKKIREDMLKANIFSNKDEREYDEEEEEERREEQARKLNFRAIRKALEKREHNFNHGSDSEYSSSDDSEEERERAEQEKKAKENNLLQIEDPEKKSGGPSSGAVTPSGRKEKHASDREGGNKKRLKRPGSPNLSDASGTDTSMRNKRPKMKHLSNQPTPSISRPDSPANVPSSSAPAGSRLKSRTASYVGGAGSDTDTAAMSDGGTRRIKLKVGSGNASPPAMSTDSRAGSPAPGASGIQRPASTGPTAMPTADDIRNVLRKAGSDGISIQQLLSSVAHPKEQKQAFVRLVQSVAVFNKDKKVMVLKE